MSSGKRKRATVVDIKTRAPPVNVPSVAASSSPSQITTTRQTGPILREKTSIHHSDGHITRAQSLLGSKSTPKLRQDGPRVTLPAVSDWTYNDEEETFGPEEDIPGEDGARPLRDSDDPNAQWLKNFASTFLDEMLRHEGRGGHAKLTACRRCGVRTPESRCRDCMGGGEMLCRSCLTAAHRQLPFHRVEHWTGTHFDKITLKALGIRIQLGHWDDLDLRCPNPLRAPGDEFVIIDVSGVHEIGLDFCGCGHSGHHCIQLLRAHLWPATTTNPRTASTFAVLRRFQLMAFESKCSALEFYESLARETDNLKYKRDKERYVEFLRTERQWLHISLLKRAGRGLDPAGIQGTRPGECALLCPCCPHPGKNIPDNFATYPPEKQFLFALFLAIDANFRLKRKDVSSEEKDPGFGNGFAFFGDVNEYMGHRSRCVAHDAVDKPDRESRGTASSGLGTVDCARHNMKRPLAIGDLQLGERYINMDWMFFRSIVGTQLVRLFVSYDIACQWHIHLWERMRSYQDATLMLDGRGKFVTFLIPKFHLPAHIEECNLKFSFHLTPDVGMTDGEGPERGWANSNVLARSTKEMGPGARRDTLDAHFNDWNHKKIIALGSHLRKKTKLAVPEMMKTCDALSDLDESLGQDVVREWTAMAKAWEVDASQLNPFETQQKDAHLAQVRAELATEAAQREAEGREGHESVRGDMHITELLAMGLQLEEQQRTLASDVSATGLHPTHTQRRAMVERTSKLRRKITTWIDIQTSFFPALKRVRDLEDEARAKSAEGGTTAGVSVPAIALWLPSALAVSAEPAAQGVEVSPAIYQHEYRLRVAQASESLHEMRRLLLVRTHMYHLKDVHARGVRANTRSVEKINALNHQIKRAAAQYRAAWAALVSLERPVKQKEWRRALHELKEQDIRGLPQATFHDPERKNKKKKRRAREKGPPPSMSWIWVSGSQAEYNPGDKSAMNEAVRIEWAKARARAMRWQEEVDLLEEEMRRASQFLKWRSSWWKEQVGRKVHSDAEQAEGETAYALRQAAVQTRLHTIFAEDWKDLPSFIENGQADAVQGEDVEEDEDAEDPEGGAGVSDEELEAVNDALPMREVMGAYIDEVLEM